MCHSMILLPSPEGLKVPSAYNLSPSGGFQFWRFFIIFLLDARISYWFLKVLSIWIGALDTRYPQAKNTIWICPMKGLYYMDLKINSISSWLVVRRVECEGTFHYRPQSTGVLYLCVKPQEQQSAQAFGVKMEFIIVPRVVAAAPDQALTLNVHLMIYWAERRKRICLGGAGLVLIFKLLQWWTWGCRTNSSSPCEGSDVEHFQNIICKLYGITIPFIGSNWLRQSVLKLRRKLNLSFCKNLDIFCHNLTWNDNHNFNHRFGMWLAFPKRHY